MREPLPSGFMDGGRFTWPKSEMVQRLCIGVAGYECDVIITVPKQGNVKKRCDGCRVRLVKNIQKRRKLARS